MKVGALINIGKDSDIASLFAELKSMDMSCCQLLHWPKEGNNILKDAEKAEEINRACEEYGVTVTAFWCGWSGRAAWNPMEGPHSLGLVPVATRQMRLAELLQGVWFTKQIHVENMVTHVGFLPENPTDPNYQDVLVALKELVQACKKNDINFLFETGQETPITLKRAIVDLEAALGEGNVGVNLDPANLLSYGKGNPLDALDVFGKYVMGVHGKDSVVRTNPYQVGTHERPLGQGQVNYPAFIAKLKAIGYSGAITIEREITGEEQKRDIRAAKKLLDSLI